MTYAEFVDRPEFLAASPELKKAMLEVAEIAVACSLWMIHYQYGPQDVLKMVELVLQRSNMVAFSLEEELRND